MNVESLNKKTLAKQDINSLFFEELGLTKYKLHCNATITTTLYVI